MFTVSQLLVLFAAVVGSGAMTGFGVWLLHRLRRAEADNRDVAALAEQFEDLRREIQEVRGGMTELQERMDFADRVLTQVHQEMHHLPGKVTNDP